MTTKKKKKEKNHHHFMISSKTDMEPSTSMNDTGMDREFIREKEKKNTRGEEYTRRKVYNITDVVWERVWAFVPRTFMAGGLFWPVANMVNFMWIPSTQRVLYVNAVGVVWNAYLSYASSSSSSSSSSPRSSTRGC